MDCNEARPLLGAAIDRELSVGEALQVERHLSTCSECQREARALQAVSRTTRAAVYFTAPDTLRERIVAALPVAAPALPDQRGDDSARARPYPLPNRPEQASGSPRVTAGTPETTETSKPRPPQGARGRSGSLAWVFGAGRRPLDGRPGVGAAQAPSSAFGWPMGAAVAAFGVAAVLAVSIALVGHRDGSSDARFADELVESHVRAQMSGHDIDVVSSDQHTVKPWFNGRLDYAPPVADLTEAGFPLAGGRLDYIGHRRVAVLVYRYRKHVIDVYVMPQSQADAAPALATLTSDGYALASWRGDGMRWWAVSDAEPAVLAQLKSALTARLDRAPIGPPQ